MKQFLYAVRDSAADSFANPFTFATNALAIRAFSTEVNNAQSMMNQHRNDYELWVIGEFESDTGIVQPIVPRSLIRAADVPVNS